MLNATKRKNKIKVEKHTWDMTTWRQQADLEKCNCGRGIRPETKLEQQTLKSYTLGFTILYL